MTDGISPEGGGQRPEGRQVPHVLKPFQRRFSRGKRIPEEPHHASQSPATTEQQSRVRENEALTRLSRVADTYRQMTNNTSSTHHANIEAQTQFLQAYEHAGEDIVND